jgi:hypothetical protein
MKPTLVRIGLAALAAAASFPAFAFFGNSGTLDIYEYVNDRNGHYFITGDFNERSTLGKPGSGWHATGYRFSAFLPGAIGTGGLGNGVDVCRFYAPGPDTHFFTASTVECGLLRGNRWGWDFEGVPFRAAVPAGGTCAAGSAPIHRLYNNRFELNDSNHRYVFDDALRAQMAGQGWTDEGVVFCTAFASIVAAQSFSVAASAIRPVAECVNEELNRGACIAMNAIPASLPAHVVNWVPPFYVTQGPQWSNAFSDLTGSDGDLHTAQPASATAAILANSFVQLYNFGEPRASAGMHVSSLDAMGALASIEPLYQFSTRPPAAGSADARVFPWRLPRGNMMEVSFGLTMKTARRANAQSHAYGAPMVELRDVKSGDAIDVTMLTFATFAPGDFVGQMDPVTRNVIVSTSFRDRATFGNRIAGNFIACDGAGACGSSVPTAFRFRMTKEDFARVVAMARESNHALSADVNDYLLVNFRFRTGILGQADVGAALSGLALDVYGY